MQPGGRAYGLFAQGENYSSELQLRRKDGTPIWVSTESRAIDSVKPQDGIIIGIGDITERKRAEAALRQTKERFDLAMQSSAISIWEWNARRGTLYLDAALAQMTGGEPRERYVTLDEMASMVHPDDAECGAPGAGRLPQGPASAVPHRASPEDGRGRLGLGAQPRPRGRARRRRQRAAHGRDQRRHHPAQARRSGVARRSAARKRAVGDEVQIRFHRVARAAHAAGDDFVLG